MPRRNTAEIEAETQRLKRFAIAFGEFLDARALADPGPAIAGSLGPDGEMVYREVHGPRLQWTPSLREGIAHLETQRPHGWRAGLREAVQDLLEASRYLSQTDVHAADKLLSQKGAPTLSVMRTEIWRTIPRLIRRGRIKTETEYYLLVERLNDVADKALSPEDRDRLAGMVQAFEERRRT